MYPFLRRVDKKAGIRATAPYATPNPEAWCVTFADRSFLPRCERIPPFKIDAPAGSAFGTPMCKTEVDYYSRYYSAQLSIRKAIEMTMELRLPATIG